ASSQAAPAAIARIALPTSLPDPQEFLRRAVRSAPPLGSAFPEASRKDPRFFLAAAPRSNRGSPAFDVLPPANPAASPWKYNPRGCSPPSLREFLPATPRCPSPTPAGARRTSSRSATSPAASFSRIDRKSVV